MRRLIIVGQGHTAERLMELGGQLGYEELRLTDSLADLVVTDHVVIAEDDPGPGRQHLLSAIQGSVMPAYLGYAAPQSEGFKALLLLAAQSIPKERLDAVSAPAGVDVGAETPEEVAIAVAAELVALRRGRRRENQSLPGYSLESGEN